MLLRHSAYYLLARGVPGLVNFAALAIYTRLLAPEEFGRYTLVLVGVGLANVVIFQWLRLVLARFFAAHQENSEKFLGGILIIFFTLATGVTGTGLLLVWWSSDPIWQQLLALAIPLLLTQSWFELNLTLATASLKPGRYGQLLSSKAAISLILGSMLAWAGLGAISPLLGLLVGHIFAFIMFSIVVWRDINPRWPEIAELVKQLRYGLPLTVTFALGWVVSGSDRLMIAWLMNDRAVGLYAAGYDLAFQSLTLLLTIINAAAYPLAVTAMERYGTEAAKIQMAQNGQLVFTAAFAGCTGLIALSPEIAIILIGEDFRIASLVVLPWIACAAAIAGIKAYHFDLAFQLSYASHWQIITTAIAAVANIVLNLIFIPIFGIVGAAWATLAAFIIAVIASAFLGHRVFTMPGVRPLLLKAIIVGITAGGSAWCGARLGDAAWISLIQGIMLGVVAAGLMSILLNVSGLRVAILRRLKGPNARNT